MRATATRVVMVWLMFATLVSGARAAVHPTLTVRLYNTSGVPSETLDAAHIVARSTLRDTGLDVRFRRCGEATSPTGPVDRCEDVLGPSDVVVRIIKAPPASTTLHREAFGVSYVVQETDRGWLATVFSDRIGHAAGRVRVSAGMLLGRVIAHEVGHLLLGRGYHGDVGVMRAEWTDELLSRRDEPWRFSMHEAARMQRYLFETSARSSAAMPF